MFRKSSYNRTNNARRVRESGAKLGCESHHVDRIYGVGLMRESDAKLACESQHVDRNYGDVLMRESGARRVNERKRDVRESDVSG